LVREFQRVGAGAPTQKARELIASFIGGTVTRLAEVSQRSLDGAYGMR